MKLKSLYTLATVILLTAATALAAGSTRNGTAKAARANAPNRIAAAADIPSQWEDIGEGTFTDDITTLYEQYKPQSYNVSIQKAVGKDGWYRIVNPFKNHPMVDDWDNIELIDGDYYIVIDASDPEQVHIPECEIGLSAFDDEYSLTSSSIYEDATDEAGTLIDNVISFEVEASLVLLCQFGKEYTNESGAFRLELPEVTSGGDNNQPIKVDISINLDDPSEFFEDILYNSIDPELEFVGGKATLEIEDANKGKSLFFGCNDSDYKVNSINVNGEAKTLNSGALNLLVKEDMVITFDVEAYRDDLTATVKIDTPENVIVTQGSGSTLSLEAGDNSITFSNKDEKSGKLTISANTGCNILSVEQNGSAVAAEAGVYEISLKDNDVIAITTEKIVAKDPVVTITTTNTDFFKEINLGSEEIKSADFEDNKYSVESVNGTKLRFVCNTEVYKVISITVNGKRTILSDGSLELTVDGDMAIDFNVVAYQTFNATIKIDDPANAIVKQNGIVLDLKAGENQIKFTDKDPASAKLTIAKTKFDLIVIHNEEQIFKDPVTDCHLITLKNEGDIVEVSAEKLPTANVTLKVNYPKFITYILAGTTIIPLKDNTEGEIIFDPFVGDELFIYGDTENFKLKEVLVNDKPVTKTGSTYKFDVINTDDMIIEFVVEPYVDVNATINVDTPDNVIVTREDTDKPLELTAGDNTISFSNKNADSGPITIVPQIGFKIVSVTLNDEDVTAENGAYTVVLAEGDVVKIETAVITYDVTIKVGDDGYVKTIKVDDTAVEPAFTEGAMTLEVAHGATLVVEGDNDNFKFKSLTVNDTKDGAQGPEFSFTVTAGMSIEFDVEAYRDVIAKINVDAPENVIVTPATAEAALELKAGENDFTFNNKDAANGKVTIAAQEGCRIVAVTHNDNNVTAADDDTFTVTLAEGDVLTIESAVNTADTHSVTIKVNADSYVKSIKVGDDTVEPAFTEGTMTAEVADGGVIVISGDNDNFKLISVSVDGVKSETAGPEFKFTVTADMSIEFEVEAYRDVTATIDVDTPENVSVTPVGADVALVLKAGENTFTFNTIDADSGKLTIAPATGYRIVSVTRNGENLVAEAGVYTVVLAENDVVKITTEVIPVEDTNIRVTVKLDNPGAVIYSYTNADSEAQDAIVNAKESVFEAEVVKYPTFYAANGYVITSCTDETGKEYDIMYDGGATFVSYSQINKSKTYTLTTESDSKTRDAAISIDIYSARKVSVKRGYYDVYGLNDGENTIRFKSGSKENEITISSTNPDEKIGDVLLNGESQRASGSTYTLTVSDGDVIKVLDKAAPVVPVQDPVVTIKTNDPDFIQLIDVATEDVEPDFNDGVMTFEVTKGSVLTIHGDADNYKLKSVAVNGEKLAEVTATSFRYTVNADLTVEFDVDRYRTLTATIDVDDPSNIKVTKGGSFSSSDVSLVAGEQTFEFTNKDENSGKLTITAQTECRITSITLNGENVAAAEFGVYKVTLAENDALKITSKKIIRDKDVIVYRDDISMIDDFTFRYSDNTHRFGFENGYTTVKFCDEDLPISCSFASAAIEAGTAEVYLDDELVDREDAEKDLFSLNPDHNSVVKIFHNGAAKFHDLTFAVDENAGEVKAVRDLVKPIDDLTATLSLHAGTKVEFTVEDPEAVKEVLVNDKPLAPEADNHYSFILNAKTSVKVVAKQSTSGISDIIGGEDGSVEIYNLQGIRIFKTINELPEGFYIINGKKVRINR